MIGATVARYRIVGKLGEGGMGVVYEAEDPQLGRRVALKFLADEAAPSAVALARFAHEARAASALNHPHICTVHDVGVHEGKQFLVMERLAGRTLKEMIGRRALPADLVISLGEQIADALDAAHRAGIVHRDLKPANLFVTERGDAKVLDFGLAKIGLPATDGAFRADAPTVSAALTVAGATLGTVAYMSPEQARGEAVDARSDLFSLGVVLYEMATGRRPFAGETAADVVAAILRAAPVPAITLQPTLPARLDDILAKALEKDVALRYQSAADLRGDLRRLRRDLGGGSAEVSGSADGGSRRPAPQAPARARRRLGLALLAASVALAGIGYLAAHRRAAPAAAPASAATPAVPGDRSLAVLPFVNSSGDAGDEYVADGITDELIAALGKVPNLHVAARSSAFSFKGKSVEVREVARRLGVQAVLEGTVRRSGQRLRVTASLVSAADGLQLWSSTFQSDGADPFAVQDEVTRGVVAGLALQLGGAALAASQAGRTADPAAHDLYLRALSYEHHNAGSESDLHHALQLYRQALDRDPGFALAYAGIGRVYVVLADAYVAPEEAYPKARAAAEAALERDGLIADAHVVLAYVQSTFEWNPVAAQREFRRALELDPNSSTVHFLYGFERCLAGATADGLSQLDRAQQLDPLSPIPPYSREVCFYIAHRFRDVIAAHDRTRQIDPGFWYLESWAGAARRELGDYAGALAEYREAEKISGGIPQYGMAITYARMGQPAAAREVLRRLDERGRTHYVPYWSRAAVRNSLQDHDGAVGMLQKAFDTRESWMPAAGRLPEIAALASQDPRAQRVLDEVAALQRSAGGSR